MFSSIFDEPITLEEVRDYPALTTSIQSTHDKQLPYSEMYTRITAMRRTEELGEFFQLERLVPTDASIDVETADSEIGTLLVCCEHTLTYIQASTRYKKSIYNAVKKHSAIKTHGVYTIDDYTTLLAYADKQNKPSNDWRNMLMLRSLTAWFDEASPTLSPRVTQYVKHHTAWALSKEELHIATQKIKPIRTLTKAKRWKVPKQTQTKTSPEKERIEQLSSLSLRYIDEDLYVPVPYHAHRKLMDLIARSNNTKMKDLQNELDTNVYVECLSAREFHKHYHHAYGINNSESAARSLSNKLNDRTGASMPARFKEDGWRITYATPRHLYIYRFLDKQLRPTEETQHEES